VRDIKCLNQKGKLLIDIYGVDDVSLEQIAMREQSTLFRDVFGLAVDLRPGQ